ncbi:MAG: AAA family ATPase [Pyrinomonadaceae bacterium]|nr:AAA family ATPase [Pyrinomonadaceae bacterium]
MTEKLQLIVIGGANGSGKTTFAREIAAEKKLKYLGADDIAAKLNPSAPENSAIEAARLFSSRLNESLRAGESLIVESTLSGLSLKKFFALARENDFIVSVFFVFLDSPELCIQRIAARVAKGGHNIPDADVRRRFTRANINFERIYKDLADDWFLIFNAGDSFEQVANGDANGVIIFDEARYQQWQATIK